MNRWIGIVGYPLTHSLSKSFHEKKIREKKIPLDFRTLEWEPSAFYDQIRPLKKDSGGIGFSVTMPYKEVVRSYCDALDLLSEQTGVVNAVKNINGKWFGFNTDGPGFLESFRKWETVPPKSATVVFFGCGATAKTLSFVLAEEGYRDFVFINRTVEKAIAWGERLKTYFNDVICHPERETRRILSSNQEIFRSNLFILNTTPIFTEHELWNVIPSAWNVIPSEQCVIPSTKRVVPRSEATRDLEINIEELLPPIWFFDVLYHPSSTWLLREFRRRSFHTMNGESMFESQARLSFEKWTD